MCSVEPRCRQSCLGVKYRSHSNDNEITTRSIYLSKPINTNKCIVIVWPSPFSATQLKPDEGTPELPEGRVRVRLHTDGSLHDVTEFEIEKVHQASSFLPSSLSSSRSSYSSPLSV